MEAVGFVLFGSVVLAVGFGIAKWVTAHTKARADKWQNLAPALGLSFEHGPHFDRPIHTRRSRDELYGMYRGHDVYLGVRSYTSSNGKSTNTHYVTYVHVFFATPLKRGLSIVKAGSTSKFFGSIFGQADMQIGHERIDYEYKIAGFEREQIAAIATAPEVARILLAPRGSFTLAINDSGIILECPGDIVELDQLEPRVAEASALAQAIVAAWLAAPPSAEERALDVAWGPLCEKKQLRYDARRMRADGEKGDLAVRLELEADAKLGWVTTVEAQFEPPLAVGLSLATEGAFSSLKKLFGAQDIQVGHAEFDRLFTVQGKDADLVRQMLSPEACTHLLALYQQGTSLGVDDEHVRFRIQGIISEPARLAALIDDVIRAASEMIAHRKAQPTGVYR